MVKKVINSYDDNRKKPKLIRPENFPAALKLRYLGNITQSFENKIQDLTQSRKTQSCTCLNPVLRLELKDLIFHLDKNCFVYNLNCFYES